MQCSEHLYQILGMLVCLFTFNQQIIHINLNLFPKLLLKDTSRHSLESSPNVFLSEGHYFVAIQSLCSDESHFFPVVKVHRDLVITTLSI